ncbi:Serotonin N-acetyltransferase [Trichoplax sp. H2]|nr:Serotonin N-acetyltransferase [Trichoplax sp. H2]|eukprot:RDD44596.1 Serotonin N-acetyltransferase [Trichoplax sp. H2]
MESLQNEFNGIVRPITQADMEAVCQIEQECFPSDEAEPPEQLMDRFDVASELFLGYEVHGKTIAFICGSRCNDELLTAQSMHEHVADGKTLCIHSVCVTGNFRRKGIASMLLKRYIAYIKENISLISIINLCNKVSIETQRLPQLEGKSLYYNNYVFYQGLDYLWLLCLRR